jgi:hypothetical protein
MGIFFIWLGLICCGVANGLIYDHVQAPQSYYYMVIPSILAVILLVVHHIYTRNWYDAIDEGDEQHSPIFGGSACLSFVAGFAAIFVVQTGEASWGFFIALMTMFVSFCLARIKEADYD